MVQPPELSYAEKRAADQFDLVEINLREASEALRKANPKLARAKIMPLIGRLAALVQNG